MLSRVNPLKSVWFSFKRCSIATKWSTPIIMGRQFSASIEPYPIPAHLKVEVNNENDKLMKILPDIVNNLTEMTESVSTKKVAERFAKALYYNLPIDSNRGLFTVLAYKSIVDKKDQTEEELHAIRILGWCSDLIIKTFEMYDDILDESEVRNNKPCWYLLKDVREAAVNDAIMMENAGFTLLHKYFRHKPNYIRLVELFREDNMLLSISQLLNYYGGARGGIENFSTIIHQKMSRYNCGHPSFYVPIASVMILKGEPHPNVLNEIKDICFDIGLYYHILNDYLDFFDETEFLRKPGNDIQVGKCSWLIAKALEISTSEQRTILIENYGKNDDEAVAKVSEIYKALDLPKAFKEIKQNIFNRVKDKIQKTSSGVPRNVLYQSLDLGLYPTFAANIE